MGAGQHPRAALPPSASTQQGGGRLTPGCRESWEGRGAKSQPCAAAGTDANDPPWDWPVPQSPTQHQQEPCSSPLNPSAVKRSRSVPGRMRPPGRCWGSHPLTQTTGRAWPGHFTEDTEGCEVLGARRAAGTLSLLVDGGSQGGCLAPAKPEGAGLTAPALRKANRELREESEPKCGGVRGPTGSTPSSSSYEEVLVRGSTLHTAPPGTPAEPLTLAHITQCKHCRLGWALKGVAAVTAARVSASQPGHVLPPGCLGWGPESGVPAAVGSGYCGRPDLLLSPDPGLEAARASPVSAALRELLGLTAALRVPWGLASPFFWS